MKTIIRYKDLKVEISINDGGREEAETISNCIPPNHPAFESTGDIRKMERRVEEAKLILKGE
ncbi:MAG: hypothetical protein CL670_13170 [Balneola sp.]|jgi:hypothetical protein|nr:hypothetical protein [Balneola sp.]MBE80100.1 hypothetical protein [Balneola sp.]|tara:strand:+ start:1616 stop:1801 length:186 start_codon:yes stop_codon:yes gene_type:complete